MRFNINLGQRYQAILSYAGLIYLLGGLLMIAPLLTLMAWPGEWVHSTGFLLPAIVISGIGIMMWRFFRPHTPVALTVQEGGVIVLLSWVVVCLFSAWPFMAILGLNFTQAVFESVSGWTTTGLSVVDVTMAPHAILLWRSITQLVGGAGLAVVMLATIVGPIGPGLPIAEGKSDQLAPHVRKSVKLIVGIYTGYAVVGIMAYRLAGMTLFDAINHSFAAISTGGFSTYPENIGHWDSAVIEAISIVLMILGNMNFLTAYLLLRGKFKSFYRNGEVRVMATLLPVCVLILILLVCRGIYPTLGKSIRAAIFEAVSALTTTGFTSTVYGNWISLGIFVLTVLMLVGGGTCSTAGGIKQYRIYLLFKSLLWELKRLFLPRTAVIENYAWQGELKNFISSEQVRQVATFLFLYLSLYVVGSGIIAAHGYKLEESLFEFASSQSTVGLSIGVTLASSPPLVLWTEILGMFLGRLEFLVVFVSLGKIVRDSLAMVR